MKRIRPLCTSAFFICQFLRETEPLQQQSGGRVRASSCCCGAICCHTSGFHSGLASLQPSEHQREREQVAASACTCVILRVCVGVWVWSECESKRKTWKHNNNNNSNSINTTIAGGQRNGGRMTHLPFCPRLCQKDDSVEEKRRGGVGSRGGDLHGGRDGDIQ